MKMRVFCVAVLVAALTAFASQTGAQPAKESEADLEKKIELLRKQIDELRKKQNDLMAEQKRLLDKKYEKERQAALEAQRKEEERKRKEEAERLAKEAAEKKKHLAKVEIRGLLAKGPENVHFLEPQQGQAWHVTINDLRWRLNFGTKKDLAEEAVKLAGKPVVIKGTLANFRPPLLLNPYGLPQPQPNPRWPNPWPPQPVPQPWPQPWPQQQWQYYQYYPVETPITINVESLQEAKD